MQSNGLNSPLSPVVYGDIAISLKNKYTKYTGMVEAASMLMTCERVRATLTMSDAGNDIQIN